MIENYYKWHSPSIGRDFQMLVFGDRGIPLILFPTSMGTYYENKDRGMIDAAGWFIDNGIVKIYCPDSIDAESWYNQDVGPAIRAYNHTCYDNLILNEIAEKAVQETGAPKVAVAGCSFGGYHAANFAFRHPGRVSHLFSMSGAFDIRSRTDGYFDDNVYFNNPVEYLPDDNDPHLWEMGIVLGTAENDICRVQNEELSKLLTGKSIPHWLDIRPGTVHDWPAWREMLPHYLSLMK
ncbi:MAG TPA: alpha/beta fold hydrolase [Chitinophagaceae bacterium]